MKACTNGTTRCFMMKPSFSINQPLPYEKTAGPRSTRPGPGSPYGRTLLDRLQRRRRKVDAEAVAPDGDHLVLAQVHVLGHIVVLVALVALELAQLHVVRLRNRGGVPGVVRSDQANVQVRSVIRREVAQ